MKTKPLFYLAVTNGKEGFYNAYIVNTSNKEYFLRMRYEERLLKPKSATFYGEIVKDRDHESISPWICDDKSETYLLLFNNLPAYCKTTTYDKYLKQDGVYQLTCKLENHFDTLPSILIKDRKKEDELGAIDFIIKDEMKKIEPNIELLLSCVYGYMAIFKEYHEFGKLRLLLSYLETLNALDDFLSISKFDIVFCIKNAMAKKDFLNRLNAIHKDSFAKHFLKDLAFLELTDDDRKEMLLDIKLDQGYDDLIDFIEYLKSSGFTVDEGTEERLDRFNASKHYKATKDDLGFEFDAIYCLIDDVIAYYLTLSHEMFQKIILEFATKSTKDIFEIKYISKDAKSSFEVDYDERKNSWY